MPRFLDIVFFLYFFTHIPISVLVDSQAVFPERFYPKQLVELKEWYCREFRDPMMMDPPAWFLTFCLCEVFLQFPFFFVASYAYFKGAAKAKWIRTPVIIYGTHVATTVIAIIVHTLKYDFTGSKYPGPRNMEERLHLCSIYAPYLIIPLMLVLDASLNSVYRVQPVKAKRGKMARFTDAVFLVYFVVHIPIAIFIDFQAILPEQWYPKQLVDVRKWYCAEFRDPMMMAPPAWFSTFILCELFLQLPFFFVAAWAYYQGAQRAQWIRIPVIIYSSHVATTVLAIFNHAITHDFSDSKYPGPRNLEERVKICGIYAPFLFVPLWILADACFSRVYVDKLVKEKRR